VSEQITIAQLRAVTQPDSVRGRANSEHWVADLYLRQISPYLTRVLLKLNVTPNVVTWLMIFTGVSAGLSLLIPGMVGVVLALFLGQLQMLWDCCDGEVARWTKRFSPAGIFLDKLGHYLTEVTIALVLGLRIAQWPEQPINSSTIPSTAALFALIIILNKALNDAVHVSRYFAGLPKLEDRKSVSSSRVSLIALVKRVFTFVPIHRMFHSVEMTIWIFILSVVDSIFEIELLNQFFDIIIPVVFFVFIGHLISILTSNKLRASE
jgi:phosphatidylglycerophosphate synthase